MTCFFDARMRSAIALCLERGVEVAATVGPDGEVAFYADPFGRSVSEAFLVSHFNEPFAGAVRIARAITPEQLIARAAEIQAASACCAAIPSESTRYDDYAADILSLTRSFAERPGKVVIARRIVAISPRHPLDVAEDYFARSPRTMRAIYYTPRSGVWIVATPELLLDACACAGVSRCSTMALAGTRPLGSTGPWDVKNSEEHRFVTDYIMDAVKAIGGSLTAPMQSLTLRAGRVEHLCDRIEFAGRFTPAEAIDRLNPTPAVCGLPKAEALAAIARMEPPRLCYGGWIGTESAGTLRAWVNLRSAMALPAPEGGWRYCQFAGGGIVLGSEPEAEWREAELKAAPLRECISSSTHNHE